MVRNLLVIFGIGALIAIIAGAGFHALHRDGQGNDKVGFSVGMGPRQTRDFTWTGGQSLTVSLPAEVRYEQGPQTSLRISGPQTALDEIEVVDGVIRFKPDYHSVGFRLGDGNNDDDDVDVVLTAPGIDDFHIAGAGTLDLQDYDQQSLAIDLAGAGVIKGQGSAKALDLHLSGAGVANLDDIAVETAKVSLSGVGTAKISPSEDANVTITGAGVVKLMQRPAHLESHVTGAGVVSQP